MTLDTSSYNIPVARSVAALRAAVKAWRQEGETVGLVPTMGAIHEGHLSLVDLAQEKVGRTVVSIFVNPTQFGPGEDFNTYPRQEADDAHQLATRGVDLIYAPDVTEMYPDGFSTTVHVTDVAEGLCGGSRPGHFDGVATIVTKLVLQCAPDIAVFGEKDYQQLQVIRRVVADLNIPTQVIGGATLREKDGMAMSSRNAYLSDNERGIASSLNETLAQACRDLTAGKLPADVLRSGRGALEQSGFDQIEYLEIRKAANLAPLADEALPISDSVRVLVAVRIGGTRLIDNMGAEPPSATQKL